MTGAADVCSVAPDAHTSARPAGLDVAHCPHCRGAVRPGAPWCTQCWADLRPAPEPAPTAPPAPAAPAAAPVAAEPAVDQRERTGAGWPCSACGQENAVELDACAACGTGFLAAMAGTDGLLVLPGVGDVGKLSRGQRIGAAVLFALLMTLGVLLLGVLFG